MKKCLLHNVFYYLLTVIAVAMLFLTFNVKSSFANINRAKAFAGFIVNIYNNTDAENNGDRFCIFGSDDVSLQIRALINKRALEDLGERIDEKRSYNRCRVTYIAKNKKKDAKYSVQFFNDRGTLTVAIFSGFVADGGMVHIGIGRRNFELTANKLKIKKSRIKIDSSIASLIVD